MWNICQTAICNLTTGDCPIYVKPNVKAKDTQTKPVIRYRPPGNGKYTKNPSRSSTTITIVPNEIREW
jgi:hypothetical protein